MFRRAVIWNQCLSQNLEARHVRLHAGAFMRPTTASLISSTQTKKEPKGKRATSPEIKHGSALNMHGTSSEAMDDAR